MTLLNVRGRRHLTSLLDGVEQVTRIEPGDILVLTSGRRPLSATESDAIEQCLTDAGVQHGGVLALSPGLTIDKIDMVELIDLAIASKVGEHNDRNVSVAVDPVVATVTCPRCPEDVTLPIHPSISDDGEWMTGRAVADQGPLEKHLMTCAGTC